MALGSSVITIVILVIVAAEIGRRAEAGKKPGQAPHRAAAPETVR